METSLALGHLWTGLLDEPGSRRPPSSCWKREKILEGDTQSSAWTWAVVCRGPPGAPEAARRALTAPTARVGEPVLKKAGCAQLNNNNNEQCKAKNVHKAALQSQHPRSWKPLSGFTCTVRLKTSWKPQASPRPQCGDLPGLPRSFQLDPTPWAPRRARSLPWRRWVVPAAAQTLDSGPLTLQPLSKFRGGGGQERGHNRAKIKEGRVGSRIRSGPGPGKREAAPFPLHFLLAPQLAAKSHAPSSPRRAP